MLQGSIRSWRAGRPSLEIRVLAAGALLLVIGHGGGSDASHPPPIMASVGQPARHGAGAVFFEQLSISLGGGIGWASLSRFHGGVDEYAARVGQINPDATLDRPPTGSALASAEISFRYYSPWHTFAQVGYAALHNSGSATLTTGDIAGLIKNHNLVLEISVLVGPYLRIGRQIWVYGGIGAGLVVFGRSYWHYEFGELCDFAAGRGGGVHFSAGIDVRVRPAVAIGAELRGRYLRTGALEPLGRSAPPLQPLRELDLSGVGLLTSVRFFVQ